MIVGCRSRSPDDAVLESVGKAAKRGERHRGAVRRGHREPFDLGRIDTVALGRAQIDANQLVAFAELRDRVAGQRHLQIVGDVLGRDVQRTRLVLVDFEVDRTLGRLIPVELDIGRIVARAHDLCDLLRQLPHRADLRPAHAELHGEADRRPVLEPTDTRTQGRIVVAQHGVEILGELLAILDGFRGDHELREIRRGELLVERQIETRRTRADEVDEVVDFRAFREARLEALCLTQGRRERGTLGQPQVDQQFRAVRAREELLRHQRKCRERQHEQHERDQQHPQAPPRRTSRSSRADGRRTSCRRYRGARGPASNRDRRDDRRHVASDARTGSGSRAAESRSPPPARTAATRSAETSKIDRVYSPVADLASAIGRKPDTVTSVPVSIGNAVLV